jgi:hypothetical protein
MIKYRLDVNNIRIRRDGRKIIYNEIEVCKSFL